jgi:RNA polymerase sigma-70 factor (ECF subfamily)
LIHVTAADQSEPGLPQLAARAQLGDRSALETLLGRLAEQLRPHVRYLTGDADRAEDVLQEVLLLVAGKLSGLREHAWVRAWAYRIATREALRQVSRDHRRRQSPLEDASSVPLVDLADESPFDPALLAGLPAMVDALPEAAQVAVRLHYLHGLTQPEVAEALAIPLGTVKSRIAYGLQHLRTRLAEGERARGTLH